MESHQPQIELLVRAECSLCEKAEADLEAVLAPRGLSFEHVLVEQRPELLDQFNDQIPVLFIDSQQFDFWKIDQDRLAEHLDNLS